MSFIIKKNIWALKASLITDEKLFNSRRKILKNLVMIMRNIKIYITLETIKT